MVTIADSLIRTGLSAGAPGRVRAFPEATHSLTPLQVQAIRTAMHLFVEEDRARGEAASAWRRCTRCDQARQGAGFISYEGGDLCNPCATVFELARARGIVHTLPEFLREI